MNLTEIKSAFPDLTSTIQRVPRERLPVAALRTAARMASVDTPVTMLGSVHFSFHVLRQTAQLAGLLAEAQALLTHLHKHPGFEDIEKFADYMLSNR